MCNPNQFRQCAACPWSNQVAQVVRTAFFCERLHRGTAPHVSGASTLVATGDYPRYFAVPVRFERRQQQFYDQASNVAGAPQIEVRRSTSRNHWRRMTKVLLCEADVASRSRMGELSTIGSLRKLRASTTKLPTLPTTTRGCG